MAKDIKLDFATGKMKNQTVSGKDRILQQIKLATRIIKGEWELDTEYGISIFEGESASVIEQEVRQAIENVDGVILVKSISAREEFDSKGEGTIIIDAVIQLDSDVIRIEERLG